MTAQQTRHQPSIPVNFRHNLARSSWATIFEQGCLIISPKLEVLSLKCKSWTCCHVKGDGFRAWPDFFPLVEKTTASPSSFQEKSKKS